MKKGREEDADRERGRDGEWERKNELREKGEKDKVARNRIRVRVAAA